MGDLSEVITYTTGEPCVWPSYDLPLVIEVEVPEFPQEIAGPFPERPEDEGS